MKVSLAALLFLEFFISSNERFVYGAAGDTCSSSDDCAVNDGTDGYYCADGTCLAIGDCNIYEDCLNPENNFAAIDCVGYFDCEANQCTKTCSDSSCLPDQVPVNCFASPCSVTACDDYKNCVDHYCDGCNAIFFDEMGTLVCNADEDDDDDTTSVLPGDPPKTCTTNSDCAPTDDQGTVSTMIFGDEGSPYCAAGICMDAGTCSTDDDCINPSNNYPIVECVGPIECGQDGMCGRDCSKGSMCKRDDVEIVNCLVDPCQANPCKDAAASCYSDYCGGCNAVHFDFMGNTFNCEDTSVDICDTDEDCPSNSQYCASHICKEMGQCETTADCVNPSNFMNYVGCTGYLTCSSGSCSKVCSTEEHCCFVPSACSDSEKAACPEATSCTKDNCNDSGDHCRISPSGILYFDAAGNQVCQQENAAVEDVCETDKDCPSDSQYCASRICKEMGDCETTADCVNPSNNFMVVECEGYLTCSSDGSCEKVCSTEEHCCFVPSACSDSEKAACPEATSCTKDNCNDDGDHCRISPSGILHFDATGTPVCPELFLDDDDAIADDDDFIAISCSTDADCASSIQVERSSRGEEDAPYCGQGLCMKAGSCSSDLDCRNPSNVYPIDGCVGYVTCQKDGTCGIDCGRTCLDDDMELAECVEKPCLTSSVEEDAVSCVDDYCGGCNAIHFDQAGFQLSATGDGKKNTPSSGSTLGVLGLLAFLSSFSVFIL